MHLETTHLFPDKPVIGRNSQVQRTTFGSYVELGESNFVDHATIGDYTYTGQFCFIQNTKISQFVSIAAMVRIGPTNHPYDRPSQHMFAYNGSGYGFPNKDQSYLETRQHNWAIIGPDVWIGHGAIIQAGITVGTGAVIGAGAVVTKDVAPYTIVGGVPAKVLKDRFPDHIKKQLLAIAWWEWDRPTLEARHHDFSLPIEEFVAKWQPSS